MKRGTSNARMPTERMKTNSRSRIVVSDKPCAPLGDDKIQRSDSDGDQTDSDPSALVLKLSDPVDLGGVFNAEHRYSLARAREGFPLPLCLLHCEQKIVTDLEPVL